MKRPLILVGGGGHCKSVIELCRQLRRPVRGILDLPSHKGQMISGVEVIGTDDELPLYTNSCDFVVTVGYVRTPSLRLALAQRILSHGGALATLISPAAHVSSDVRIGAGTVVLSGACVNAGAVIGDNVIVNTLSAVEHDAHVGDYCHISTGAMINGECRIGQRTFIGSNATVINGVVVGDDVVVGAGSTVCDNLTVPGVYFGSPAVIQHRI